MDDPRPDGEERAPFGPALLRLVERGALVGADPARLLELLVPEVDRRFGPHREVLCLLEGDPPNLVVAAHHGASLPPGEHLVSAGAELLLPRLMQGLQVAFAGRPDADGIVLRLHVDPSEVLIILPLMGGGELVGSWIVGLEGDRPPQPHVRMFLHLLSRYLGPLTGWVRLRLSLDRRYGHLPQTERLAELGRLVAGVAHELGSPLQSIISMAELLVREEGRSDPVAAANRILRSAMSCRGIVQDLLTYARREPRELRPLKIQDVLLDALEMERFGSVGEVQLRMEGEDLPEVRGDPQRLCQVFLNLIGNALHAVRDSGRPNLVTVEVSRVEASVSPLDLPPDSSVLRVAVIDQGPGVPAELRSRIFEPFFTTKEMGVGTGLGLSISRSLVAGMGGALFLDETHAPGARFVVDLPVIAEHAASRPATPASDEERRTPGPCRILLVDDDRDILETYEAVLALDGHVVKGCDRGNKALQALRDDLYDVILCDIRLPDISGVRFLEEVRREHPGMAGRVIFATGDVLSDATRTFLDSVPNPSLIKPFRIEDLYEAVREVLVKG